MENVVILGGGPAGCTAGLYTARANLNPLVLEGEPSGEILPGGQLMTTTEVENFPGYPEGVSGQQLMADLKKQAERFGARFEYKTATAVDLNTYPFIVFAGNEKIETKSIIIATGASARYLGLPNRSTGSTVQELALTLRAAISSGFISPCITQRRTVS